jgi:DNA-directed RNA polymerase subunit RPC12/RpoP
MKKILYLLVAVSLLGLLIPGAASAQQEGQALHLGLVRNFGYGGFGKIQGNFTLKIVDPPTNLVEVRFYMEDELMETVLEEPFRIQFHTSDYADGEHQMRASGVLADGSILDSNMITTTFLSSENAWAETQQIIFPLLIGIGALTLIGLGAPFLLGRNKEFVLGKYGPAGGAVCPRCELPFSRPFLSPNMMVGKLVRCPHCGKVSILPRASSVNLQAAESRYSEEGKTQIASDGKDDFKQMIEDSRFED